MRSNWPKLASLVQNTYYFSFAGVFIALKGHSFQNLFKWHVYSEQNPLTTFLEVIFSAFEKDLNYLHIPIPLTLNSSSN